MAWKPTGFCGECCREIEAIQPSGLQPRHVDDKTPLCSKREPMDIQRSGDLCPMGKGMDEALIAKLDHYGIDIRDIKHWRYVKHTTGAGHRVLEPKFPGEE